MHSSTDISSRTDASASAAVGSPRILIAAGGTGGHVYPAIAIADAILAECAEAELLFVGTKDHMEWKAVPRAGYRIVSIWISGFHRRLTLQNLLFPVKLATSIVQSLSILRDFRPQAVVACGGYAAGPIGWVAARRGIPLVLQEQNSFPGVTNRLLGRYADRIFTAFREAESWFPEGAARLTGNPTREELRTGDRQKGLRTFDFDSGRATLLVLGGSGGARTINEAIKRNLTRLHDGLDLQIVWQCGPRYLEELKSGIDMGRYPRLRLVDFLHAMPEAYAVADLVISRAGALTCSELALTGTPSVLVPSPNVAGDHQTKNAQALTEEGAAQLLPDEEAEEGLGDLVARVIHDRKRLEEMQQAALALARPDAATVIANEILEMIRTKEVPS